MKFRKGDEALNVSVFVALLALFILAYVVLLPPDERNELLNITDDDDDTNRRTTLDKDILISESPGIVRPLSEEVVKNELAPIDLFLTTEPEVSSLANSVSVSRNLFSNKEQHLAFSSDDVSNMEKATLFFVVQDSSGNLIIELNNNVIFNEEIEKGTLGTVNLPLGLLRRDNIIKFSVSPSFLFSNFYNLQDIKVREETSFEKTKQTRTFRASKSEINRLDDAELEFFVFCKDPLRETAHLIINLNDKSFKSIDLPCIAEDLSFDIDPDDIEEGTNTVEFSLDKGNFRFTNIKVNLDLTGKAFPTFFFAIDEDDFDDIVDNDLDVILKMVFLDDDERKQAEIFINGERIFLDTRDDKFTKDISNKVEEGGNELKIVPLRTFEIIHLEVRFED